MPIVKRLIFYAVLPIFSISTWDIAVITDDAVDFFENGKPFRLGSEHLKELSSGSYDPVNGDLYVSDSNQRNASLFKINSLNSDNEVGVLPIVSKQPLVKGIAFDPVTGTLFWTTGNERTIRKLDTHSIQIQIQHGKILHTLKDQIPMGITVDSCRQTLYWTNCNNPGASIESSKVDGSDVKTIVKRNLFQPLGIVVDHKMKKIYWCDEREGVYYSIERSDLDGRNREFIIQGTHHQPVALSLAGDKVYWADWIKKALWSLPKNSNGGVEPEVVRSFGKTPIGVLSSTSYIGMDVHECPLIAPVKQKIEDNYKKRKTFQLKEASYDLPIKTENDLSLKTYCLNNGSLVNNVCNCNKGFRGYRCENSVCHNYCFTGKCAINHLGQPICYCPPEFAGPRCEIDRCQGVCLNGGSCSVKNNVTECLCKPDSRGERCEFKDDVFKPLCQTFCDYNDFFDSPESSTVMNTDDTNSNGVVQHNLLQLCSCPEQKSSSIRTFPPDQKQHLVPELSGRFNVLITSTLGALCIILTVAVIFLTTKVHILKKRPRIRKRIVVNKPLAPITCRPQTSPDQCEITIENCCNMNICETPCFEPDFRSSKATFKRKSEDKKMLINSMHSNSSLDEDY